MAFAVDERYVLPLAASVRSLLENSTFDEVELYVLSFGISEESRDRLTRSWEEWGAVCRFVDIRSPLLAGLPENSRATPYTTVATYGRLLLPRVLPPDWDRVLYLDADTLTVASLAPLWGTELGTVPVAAVQDREIRFVSSHHGIQDWAALGMERETPYFNAGVLLINLDQWRATALAEKALRYISDHSESILHMDQEGLNAVISGNFVLLGDEWNVSSYWHDPAHRTGPFQDILERAAIRHFTWRDKPWTTPVRTSGSDLFFGYLDRTPWRGRRPWDEEAESAAETQPGKDGGVSR
ncbi:glycosyltransferase family 8 protein [Streptomyces sp. PTY087I2]|uniref:glycosyltransferase family 8 protein n=1 Tax=Streptomyces sp. PTY087I2 TaxID=1819298 RepID=UPI0008288AE6|nr:glycosyltransferase family 8 protein [Streptomyces sp. PTY087I2]OCC10569.1 General stress protein A [Streptomyces sp. PTY087I2]